MNCNCKHCGAILAVVILVFSFWDVAWASWLTSKWIIVAAAAIMFLHDFVCPCNMGSCKPVKKVPAKKKTKKKKRR